MVSKMMKMRRSLFCASPQQPGSPVVSQWSDSEIEAFLTPYRKFNDSGLGTDEKPSTLHIPRITPLCKRSGVKRKLFSHKRPADNQDIDDFAPVNKKQRDLPTDITERSAIITEAVEQLTSESDIVADGSRAYSLPTIKGKHSDLKAISPDTVADVLRGSFDDRLGKVTVVDCRYPYEFDGGHIRGAENRYTKDDVHSLLTTAVTTSDKPHVLIFHCEFSSERGPKMYRFLRAQDREVNKESYPRLTFPEVYLLEGGYTAFFTHHTELCAPDTYTPMLHKDHGENLRHFRVKSKSWAAGDKAQKPKRRAALRRSLTPVTLDF